MLVYKIRIFRLAIIGIILFVKSELVVAQIQDEVPEPKVWAQSLEDKYLLKNSGIAYGVLVQVGKDYAQQKADYVKLIESANQMGFLRFFSDYELEFNLRVNNVNSENKSLPVVTAGSFPVHLQLEVEGKKIKMQRYLDSNVISSANWTISDSASKDGKTFLKWLSRKLNYDGIIVDYKKPFVLVGLIENRDKLGQAVLVAKSEEKFILKKKDRLGAAILQLLKVDGSYAVFEVLASAPEVTTIPLGSKIVLGRKIKMQKNMTEKSSAAKPLGESKPTAEPKSEGE